MGGILAGLTRRAEFRIVGRLRDADATEADRARPLTGLHPLGRRRLRRMLAAGAVREVSPGTYYLDEQALAIYRRHRRRRGLTILGGALLAALGALHIGRKQPPRGGR